VSIVTEPRTIKDRFRGFLPVVVDVETAGFNPQTDALLEVAMMTVKMDEHGHFTPGVLYHANIRPFAGAVINQANIEFLGIDPFDEKRELQDEATSLLTMFKAIQKEVKAQHCKRAILVGHNGHFDQSFINAAAERNGLAKKNPFHPFSVLDTASLSALIYGQTVLAKSCIASGLGFDMNSAHGAAYDTTQECQLFCNILNSYTRFAGFPQASC
jgi:ribonuclease T